MFSRYKGINRRSFLQGVSSTLLGSTALLFGCKDQERQDVTPSIKNGRSDNADPAAWWDKKGFIVHDTVDTSNIEKRRIGARVNGEWQEYNVKELPDFFVNWSLKERVARLDRMVKIGGMDPRDLAGSHNACVATYGGHTRDSAFSLNTAYKGMGFTILPEEIADTIEEIRGEHKRIEREVTGNPFNKMAAKAEFLVNFYNRTGHFDKTKQVSLELFTDYAFQTHTFLNMMANPIASASFLAFPTFEIRAVPQLLHPRNPDLSKYEKALITYTNAIHDFIHDGLGDRIVCVYHIIELFNDTPNEMGKGRRVL